MNQHQKISIKRKTGTQSGTATDQWTGKKSGAFLIDNRSQGMTQKKQAQGNADEHTIAGDKFVQESRLPVQRIVRQNRGKPGFRSTLTGKDDYPDAQTAQAAEDEFLRLQDEEKKKEHPDVPFKFIPAPEGPPIPQDPLATALLNNPIHFGPVLTTGGDVSSQQINTLAKQPVMPQGQKTGFSARNTYAMVLSSASGQINVHSHTRQVTPINNLSLGNNPPADFYAQHSFKQGPPPLHVHLPDTRSTAHAEALAAHSDAYDSAVEQNAHDLLGMQEAFDYDPELGLGVETESQMQNLINFLSVPPVQTHFALNRASCGHKGNSGHVGGCNQEMAETGKEYKNVLAKHLQNPTAAFLATATGLAGFGVSAAGPYKHQGDPRIMTNSGVNVSMHNAFDWKTGQGKHLSKEQQQYLAQAEMQSEKDQQEKMRSHGGQKIEDDLFSDDKGEKTADDKKHHLKRNRKSFEKKEDEQELTEEQTKSHQSDDADLQHRDKRLRKEEGKKKEKKSKSDGSESSHSSGIDQGDFAPDFVEMDGKRYERTAAGIGDNGTCLWDTLRSSGINNRNLRTAAQRAQVQYNSYFYLDRMQEFVTRLGEVVGYPVQIAVSEFNILTMQRIGTTVYGRGGNGAVTVRIGFGHDNANGHFVPPAE